MNPRQDFWLGVTLLLLAALSWSTAGLFPRLVSTDMATTLFWRSLLGGLTVLGFYLWVERRAQRTTWWRLSAVEWSFALITAIAMLSFVSWY